MGFNDFFAEVPRLETPRLVLRPFGREDMDSYLKWMQDPAVHRFLGGGVRLPQGEKQVSDWLKNINGRLLRSKTVLTWCAVCKKEDQVVGRVDLGGFVKNLRRNSPAIFPPAAGERALPAKRCEK